mgnify:CR=1 FL=1
MQEVDIKNELTLSGPILQDLQAIITTATIDDDLSEKHAASASALQPTNKCLFMNVRLGTMTE